MSLCAECKIPFVGGIIVACCCCNSLYHANYTSYKKFVEKNNAEPIPNENGIQPCIPLSKM